MKNRMKTKTNLNWKALSCVVEVGLTDESYYVRLKPNFFTILHGL